MELTLGEQRYGFSVPAMLALAFAVGVIGGTYGYGQHCCATTAQWSSAARGGGCTATRWRVRSS